MENTSNNNQNNNQNNNVYENIGQNIKESLTEGLLTGDFRKLNEAISDSVKDVVREAGIVAGEGIKNATSGYTSYTNRQDSEAYARMLQEKRKAHLEEVARQQARAQEAREQAQARRRAQMANNAKNASNALSSAFYRPVGKGSSIAYTIIGAFGLVISVSNVLAALIGILAGAAGLGSLLAWGIFGVAFGSLFFKGIGQRKMLDRAYKYAQMAGSNMYAQISSIASSLGLSVKEVQKDIKKMLRKGYFPQGYLDEEGKTLMLSDDVYKQYQQAKDKQAEEIRKKTEEALAEDEELKKLSPEDRQKLGVMISAGNEYINKLHELNNDIPGEEITLKLTELEDVLKEIFTRVKEHPEQMDRMTKLMDYYLPTMNKLVEAYAEYDKVSAPGKDILDAKAEIEQTLDTINDAFDQLLNNLFQDSVWDVTTDAQVLKTMLKQEGLT